jgi:hypothetical protein
LLSLTPFTQISAQPFDLRQDILATGWSRPLAVVIAVILWCAALSELASQIIDLGSESVDRRLQIADARRAVASPR